MAQDIILLDLDDDAVHIVHITAAEGASGDLDNHVAVLQISGLRNVDCFAQS